MRIASRYHTLFHSEVVTLELSNIESGMIDETLLKIGKSWDNRINLTDQWTQELKPEETIDNKLMCPSDNDGFNFMRYLSYLFIEKGTRRVTFTLSVNNLTTTKTLKLKEKQVVYFPGWIRHSVEKSDTFCTIRYGSFECSVEGQAPEKSIAKILSENIYYPSQRIEKPQDELFGR